MNSFEEGYNKNILHYKKLIGQYRDANRVGSWGGVDQTPRYRELIDYNLFKNASILEIGCGLGGFLDYCIDHDIICNGEYCGIDILEEMQVENARRYPNYRFMTRNIVEHPMKERFDIVVICGLFNIKTPNGKEYMERILDSAYKCCNSLLSFNFISSYVNFSESETEYHNPVEVAQFCIEKLSPKVIMNHHYWKCDTSCKVYR